jgi:hypothetical protein
VGARTFTHRARSREADTAELVTALAAGDVVLRDGGTLAIRGAPRADVPALERLLLRVSALVEAHPEVAELECNPVVVTPDGATAVDVRVRLVAASEHTA